MHNNSSHKNQSIATIIVAAGRGQRMGGKTPKQYRQIDGQAVLEKSVNAFTDFGPVIVVIHPDDQDLWADIARNLPDTVLTVFGGETRTHSVKNGLSALGKSPPDIVLIHDAARPFVTRTIIQEVIDGLAQYDAIAPSLPIVDAIKSKTGQHVDRDSLLRVQTPQGFAYPAIATAYENLGQVSIADDIAVAKQAGLEIGFSQGHEDNKKITFEGDMRSSSQSRIRIGSGYDVHRITSGKTLVLGGIEIEAGFALKGHSDADVVLHAITDALLGAIAADDIGEHFPPSDPQWRGARSDMFLKHAVKLIGEASGSINNIDVTIICERPKIKPYRQAMRANIAQICGLELSQISVKATTTEGLGFTGRGEGIAASAICSVSIHPPTATRE